MTLQDYEIVNKADVEHLNTWGKWLKLFDSLPSDKAIKFLFNTKKEAQTRGAIISSSCRQGRRNYKIAYVVKESDASFILYVWKEARS